MLGPNARLRDRVASIVVAEAVDCERTVLPSAAAVLGFQLRGRVKAGDALLSTAGVTGIQSTPRRYGYVGRTSTILVRFTAQGAACLGVPAQELAGRSLALTDILPSRRFGELLDRLGAAESPERGVALVERLLAALPYAEDRVVGFALTALESGRAVAAVARDVGLSERQLQRRFLERVGVSPKRYAMLCRFERALRLTSRGSSLTEAAFEAGYCDQSHFIREFRRFSGSPPGALRA